MHVQPKKYPLKIFGIFSAMAWHDGGRSFWFVYKRLL